MIVIKRVFDSIPCDPSQGPRVCTATLECYSTFVELASVRYLGGDSGLRAIQGSFANCNISVDLDLFNGGIIEYI